MIEKIDTIYGTFNKDQLKQLKGYIDETVELMETIKVTNQSMADIATMAYGSLKIPKKMIRRLAKARFKQSLKEEVTEFKEFESLFECLQDVKG